jgi:putative hydrolase of the HAD superfamily
MKYKHLFFDLDRTLWDFETNSRQTLIEMYEEFELGKHLSVSSEQFIKSYKQHNEELWNEYRVGKIDKDYLRSARFLRTIEEFGTSSNELAEQMGFFYVSKSPEKTGLFPNTIEMLDELSKYATLHIITNGFDEVQHIKLKQSGLTPYFDHIVTSEHAGVKKPDPAIFEFALVNSGATTNESLMIGDDLPVDLLGAKHVGIDQAYFNPTKKPHQEDVTFEYQDHLELVDWLLGR